MSRIIPNFSPDSSSVKTVGDVGDSICCCNSSGTVSESAPSSLSFFDSVAVVSVEENLPIDEKDKGGVIMEAEFWTPFPLTEENPFRVKIFEPKWRYCLLSSLSNENGKPTADVAPTFAVANDLTFRVERLQDEAKLRAR